MKRFTATEKWQDAWFRKLPPPLKCLWLFLCDNCDHAGVIDPDWEMVSLQVGAKVNLSSIEAFGPRIKLLQSGKLWIAAFVKFQYGTPNKDCKQHAPVFNALEKHGISIDEVKEGRLLAQTPGKDCLSNGNHSSSNEHTQPLIGAYTQEQDKIGQEGSAEGVKAKSVKNRGTQAELEAYAVEIGLPLSDGTAQFDKWTGNGWTNGGKPIVDWRATFRNHKQHGYLPSQKGQQAPAKTPYQRNFVNKT